MNDNNNNYQLIRNLAGRENITEKEVIEMLSLAIQEVYQKKFASGELQVVFEPKKKQFMAYRVYQIVEQVNDSAKQITKESKLLHSKKNFMQKENLFFQRLNLKNMIDYKEVLSCFHLLLQKNRQKKLTEELLPFQGKIIEGSVREACPGYCLVSLLGSEGLCYWGKSEWLSRSIPLVGQTQRFLVKETKAEGKYPVILARRSEDFLRKLLVIEIPEIAQGKIIIQDILRWPGAISKVIVRSKISMRNPLGACIGERGIRAQNIEKEMSPERIDLVEWKEDIKAQLTALFSPVEILGFCRIQKRDDLVIIVRPEQLSLSLISKGKMVQLIEDYLKVKIKILTWEEINKENAVTIETTSSSKDSLNTENYPI